MILKSWEEGLAAGNIKECAWSFLLNGYSGSFIEKHYKKIPDFVNNIVKANNATSLYHLLALSHISDPTDKFSTLSCAEIIKSISKIPVQIIAANQDRIAGTDSVKQLADLISCVEFEVMSSGMDTLKLLNFRFLINYLIRSSVAF